MLLIFCCKLLYYSYCLTNSSPYIIFSFAFRVETAKLNYIYDQDKQSKLVSNYDKIQGTNGML